jgi:hypothetical protein
MKITKIVVLACSLLSSLSTGCNHDMPQVDQKKAAFQLNFNQTSNTLPSSRAFSSIPNSDIALNLGVVINRPSLFVSQSGSPIVKSCTLATTADGNGNSSDYAIMINSSDPTTLYAFGSNLSGELINEALLIMPNTYGEGNYLITFTYDGKVYRAPGYYNPLPNHWLIYGNDMSGLFSGIGYIMFVPAAIVGDDFTYFLYPYRWNFGISAPSVVDPRESTSVDNWMTDPFNIRLMGLVEAASTNSGHDQLTVASYFFDYFTKYANTSSTSLQGISYVVNSNVNDPDTCNTSCDYRPFLVIGLNNDIDLSDETQKVSVIVTADLERTSFQYDPEWISYSDILHDTLRVDGNPPIYFSTQVVLLSSTYSIHYDMNEATDGSIPLDPTEYNWGDTAIVLGNVGNLNRIGFDFAGWNTKPDGSGTTYLEGDSLTLMTPNVHLYAIWTPEYTTEMN